ncbi:hypothetical protein N7520_002168 [Penicillium odoratum]|uniref:uncharacterized protein n=1 Tax=Penicillium odoratum TaxID=1167516 RepID=UPI002546A570|nr:uncharacterized protein N7520_002168 [Penicillium odoratum]KAJ5771639.1 hypothetical protein N7520_002168 [Penicillium odoratum]
MGFSHNGDRPYQRKFRGDWRGGRSERSSVILTPPPPLGEVLATIDYHDLEDSTSESHQPVQITNTQYLTSYNWVNKGEPTIIVPESLPSGEPPAWTPLSQPTQLRADSGVYFRDLNSARYPTHPLEPMIQAILVDKPDFCVRDLDIVGCGSTLGNLLRFARGKSPAFRVLIEVIGNTVFFRRRENSPKETIQNIQGFGHTFPEAYTMWGESVRKSESHQRLINFDFANMNCLVRFEADGYLPDLIPGALKARQNPLSSKSDMEPEDLLSSIQGAAISTVHPAITQKESGPLRIFEGGRYIPQCAIFDLKTRSARKANIDTLSEEMARLWIRQIPNFVLAYHKSGKFDDIRVQDVREEMERWEECQQPGLQKFATLLEMVISFARSTEDGKLEIEHEEEGKDLNLRIPGGIFGSVLPPALADMWDI